LIGIFPRESEVRWCKVQLFSGGRDPSRHCLSAVEGMDGDGQVLVLRATRERVERHEVRFPRGGLTAASSGWSVTAPGVSWTGDWPDTVVQCDAATFEARASAGDVLTWIAMPRVLTYWSAFGEVQTGGQRGVALVEHAWGMDIRLDVARWSPRTWQWDVLAFEGGGACAALTIDLAAGLLGVRGGGRIPGETFEKSALSRIEVDAWEEDAGRRVPRRWRGQLRLGGAVLAYEAQRSTPVAPVVPGGGFVGFEFEARWKGKSLEGSGFTEYRAG
jgi:hypothetical protein